MNFHLKIPLYQRFHTFFGDFTPFFTPFSKIFFHFIVRLLKCYKNIYDLHTFSIRNSSKLAISHLFSRFHTFFSHLFQLFFYSLRTPHSYPPVKKKITLIATSVLKFCLGTNFVTPYAIRHTYRHLDHNTSSWPKGPRANKKQHILVNFELWYKCRYSIQYSFQRGIRWFNQICSILNNYVTV